MKLGLFFVLSLSINIHAAGPLDIQMPQKLEDKMFVRSLYSKTMTFPAGCTSNNEIKNMIEGRKLSDFPTSSYRFNKNPDWVPSFEYETGNFNNYSPILSQIESCCLENIKSLAEAGFNLREPFLASPELSSETHFRFYSDKSFTTKDGVTKVFVRYYIPNDPSMKGEGELTVELPDKTSRTTRFQLEGDSPIESLHQLMDGKQIPVVEIENKQDPTLLTALDYARAFKNDPNWKNRDKSCFSEIEKFLLSEGVLPGDELIKDAEYKDLYKGSEKRVSMLLSLEGSIPLLKSTLKPKPSNINESDRNLVKELKNPSLEKTQNPEAIQATQQ